MYGNVPNTDTEHMTAIVRTALHVQFIKKEGRYIYIHLVRKDQFAYFNTKLFLVNYSINERL
jgi:hypothetical protein